jgi:tetratricopeptide (TPR) repeat protein
VAPSLRVQRIACDKGGVRLTLSGPATPAAGVLTANGDEGPRIYIDVAGATLAVSAPASIARCGPVRRVRAAQFSADTARVVIELAHPTPFRLHSAGSTVSVAFGDSREPPAAPRHTARHPDRKARARASHGAPAAAPAATAAAAPASPASAPPPAPTPSSSVPSATASATATTVAPPAVIPMAEAGPAPAAPQLPPTPVAAAPAPASEPVPAVAALPPTHAAPPASSPLAPVNGIVFVWPDLQAPEYGDAEAEPYRQALERWRVGQMQTGPALIEPHEPAAMYLAGDLTALRATAGLEDPLNALGAYERALRTVPEFPDAARAELMVGYLNLHLGFAPEATAAFNDMLRRKPDSPLAPYAKLGLATALRLRHRPAEARKALDEVLAKADGETACHARLEEARIASAAGEAAVAADLFRRLSATCPGVLALPGALGDQAEALAAAGALDEARRVLSMPRSPRGDEENARLELLAGRLATAAGDTDGARTAYARVRRMDGVDALKLEAQMRLAALDAATDPAGAAAALLSLVDHADSVPLRASVLSEAADATARAGNLSEALALLDKAATLGPEGEAQADGRRAELLGHLLEHAVQNRDAASVAMIYAAYATQVDQLAAARDRLAVADVLGHFGLHDAAARLLGQGPDADDPLVAVARAEALLAAGEAAAARAAAERLLAKNPLPDVAVRAQRVVVRGAIATGDVDGAAAQLGKGASPELYPEVARAFADRPDAATHVPALLGPVLAPEARVSPAVLVAAGDAALAANLPEQAAVAYGRALEQAVEGPARVRAAAGVAQAAVARGDRDAARNALAVAAEADPLARRVVAALDRSRALEVREADAH